MSNPSKIVNDVKLFIKEMEKIDKSQGISDSRFTQTGKEILKDLLSK